jgi:hypothetical protein
MTDSPRYLLSAQGLPFDSVIFNSDILNPHFFNTSGAGPETRMIPYQYLYHRRKQVTSILPLTEGGGADDE